MERMAESNGISVGEQQKRVKLIGASAAKGEVGALVARQKGVRVFAEAASTDQSPGRGLAACGGDSATKPMETPHRHSRLNHRGWHVEDLD